jgi:uncharacterized protein YecE (DUF72 family)
VVVTDDVGWPAAPEPDRADLAYYRLRRSYDEGTLRAWAERAAAMLRRVPEVHVYFKHEPGAPERALRLAELVRP